MTIRADNKYTYKTWSSMRGRCNNPNDDNYPRYGGRGIVICSRWDDFELFLGDMGPRPQGHSIDRVDPDGGYNPDNCRWLTFAENSRRARVGLRAGRDDLEYNGVSYRSYREASIHLGVNRKTISRNHKLGLPLDHTKPRPNQPKNILIGGASYQGVKSAAQALGVTINMISDYNMGRITESDLLSYTPEEPKYRICIVDGVEYPSVAALRRAFGVTKTTARNWANKGTRKPKLNNKPFTILGVRYNSLAEAAKELSCSIPKISQIKKGIIPEEYALKDNRYNV